MRATSMNAYFHLEWFPKVQSIVWLTIDGNNYYQNVKEERMEMMPFKFFRFLISINKETELDRGIVEYELFIMSCKKLSRSYNSYLIL